MPVNSQIAELKNQIKAAIRYHSDRGFVPYSGCNRVCGEMMAVMQLAEAQAQAGGYQQAFDLYIMVLSEAMKLIAHADTSSGAAGDVIDGCIQEIDKLCQIVQQASDTYFFNTLIKISRNKVFHGWEEHSYQLLKSAVYFVRTEKQAQKIYDLFPVLGTMYSGKDYPDKFLITHGMLARLEGAEVADRYLLEHLEVEEVRMLVVENALAAKNYDLAESLCLEVLPQDARGYLHRQDPWAYYLERLYAETGNEGKYEEMIRFILFHGNTAYFEKLKELYQKQGIWTGQRAILWQELASALMDHDYAALLAREEETSLLLDVVKRHNSYIMHYGKLLARDYLDAAFAIYEEYITAEAQEATDRRKYKNVCRIIKNLAEAGGKGLATEMVERLAAVYPRRPAMLEELATLKKKIER